MTRAGRIFALPLMLLALWLQAGAAAAAARAQAEAASPFGAIPICSADGSKPGPSRPEPAGRHGAAHCAFCLVSAAAQPPPLPVAGVVLLPGLAAAAIPSLPRHVQPRGPPQRAPRARGPPLLA